MKFGDLIRESHCLDTDLNKKSESIGNLAKISIKRSSLEMTDCTGSGRFLDCLKSPDEFPAVFSMEKIYRNAKP